jgi:uncharacterized protein YbcI
MTPPEVVLTGRGEAELVQRSRAMLQFATKEETIATIEQIAQRKVRAFSSAIDPSANTVFTVFVFE